MAKESKGILIMNNWFDLMIDILTPEQTIELLKLIRAKKDKVNYETTDVEVKTHWFHMQHNVQSSIETYAKLSGIRSENGKKGGAKPGNQNASKNYKNNQNNQKQPKQAMDKEKDKDTYPADKSSDLITSLDDVISSQEQLGILELFNN